MKIGDLIEASDPAMIDDVHEARRVGNVLRFDTYQSAARPHLSEKIVEIHWNGGDIGWILQSRIRLVKDLDELTYAQLEEVQGGMTPELFDRWRCSIVNKGSSNDE